MIRRNHSVSRTCRLLRVARSKVKVLLKRADDWKDRRLACNRSTHLQQDDSLQEEIQEALVRHPSFGYKRLTAVINRKRQKTNQPRVNAKRVYCVAKQRNLLLVSKPSLPDYSKEHKGMRTKNLTLIEPLCYKKSLFFLTVVTIFKKAKFNFLIASFICENKLLHSAIH